MKHFIIILLSLLTTQAVTAQRLIRRNSRHYVEAQSLPDRVEPLLTDVWDQFSPNNDMCPLDTLGQRCVVGCVATAMSQVMHYWRWPVRGTGSHEYNDSTGCMQVLSANFAEHVYDWENMLDLYEEGKYTQKQADAVALLSSDCGISVDMKYTAGASGARSIRQPLALANFFQYDRGVQMYFRDFYSLAEITLMLKKELAAGRPVLISAYNSNGGHAYVLDGYDERDWFHIHVGNPDNEGDGWTYLPYMTPDMPTWCDKDSPENGLNILQMFTLGLMPNNHPEAIGYERHNFAFQCLAAVRDERHPSPVYARDKMNLAVHDMSNIGWNTLEDSVALMLKRNDELVCPLYVYDHDFLLEEIDDTTYTDTLSVSIPPEVEDGVYTIVPMYRDNAAGDGKEWREALTCTGTPNYLIAHVEGQQVTLSSDTASTAFLTLEDIDIPDMLVNTQATEYSVTLKNHNTEIAGRLYLLMEPMEERGVPFYLHRQGVTMAKDEVSERRFYKTKLYAPHTGVYRLHVLYEANLFADELIELPLPEERIITILHGVAIQIAQR